MKFLWTGSGHFFICLGVVGVFLPLLPTTPFLLLAFFCYSKGSENFQRKLLEHPLLGPPVKDWIKNGVIRPYAKALALLVCSSSLGMMWFYSDIPNIPKIIASLILFFVCCFIASRPSKGLSAEKQRNAYKDMG